jgi:hypothetical protein
MGAHSRRTTRNLSAARLDDSWFPAVQRTMGARRGRLRFASWRLMRASRTEFAALPRGIYALSIE